MTYFEITPKAKPDALLTTLQSRGLAGADAHIDNGTVSFTQAKPRQIAGVEAYVGAHRNELTRAIAAPAKAVRPESPVKRLKRALALIPA